MKMREVDDHLNEINIQIAGHVIGIKSKYRISPTLYANFRTEMKADVYITINDEDIDFTRAQKYNLATIKIKPQNVLRKISEVLLQFDVLLLHGAVVAVNGKSYLFTAPSGIGKTTHILKWLKHLPDACVVNGDKPFIKFGGDNNTLPMACGSPWAGKENMYTNTMVPLNAIILMERSENNHITQISFDEAFPTLLQQTYRPESIEKMRKTLKLLQRINSTVKFYRFQCNNFKDDCFDVAYNALIETDEFPAC